MKTFLLLALICFTTGLHAQNTPLTEPIPDETLVTITCELTTAPRYKDVPVFHSQTEADNTKGTYHYKIWLPSGYNTGVKKPWPCLFVMSPGGDATLGEMSEYAKTHGYIVVLLVEAKNGAWEPIMGNFLAAHDDIIQRVRVAEGQKIATGFSGGARASSIFVQLRPGFRGLVLQSAGPAFDEKNEFHIAGIKRNAALRIAMTMGSLDSNKVEVARMEKLFNRQRLAVFPFEGDHKWASAEVFGKAMDFVTQTGPAPSTATKPGDAKYDVFKK